MLLVIDTGNTNTLFAVHDGSTWRGQWRSATDMTKTADDYAVWLSQLMEINQLRLLDLTACIISTVVPQSLFNQRNFARRYLKVEPLVVGENVRLGVEVRISRPSEVGADRLVNAIGAHAAYSGPLIVIDSGTATTFDVVAADGSFEGGIIAPGINLSMKALHEAAAKLPRVAIQRPERVIGRDTVQAMQYGQPMTAIATGGVASLFEGAARRIDHFDPDVTIRGLLLLYQRNVTATSRGA
jgi:type III pantothenate kinase